MSTPSSFDPQNVNLDSADPADVVCYLQAGSNEYNGQLGARISALFVILLVSSCATVFPVVSTRVRRFRIPLYAYLFARYFGAGVIIATAFVHLLDPAYSAIGPNTCVGMTGNWAVYSWPPAIAMTSAMVIFLFDFIAEWYVEGMYGPQSIYGDVENIVTTGAPHTDLGPHLHSSDAIAAADRRTAPSQGAIDGTNTDVSKSVTTSAPRSLAKFDDYEDFGVLSKSASETDRAFREQIAAFLILEFGVLFHSVLIGLNLGVAGDEFATLYPVLVFHQSFEGLGVGARLSVIPFPRRLHWLPWALCAAYGLTTPIAIAIGLGLRTTYDNGSFTAHIVSGIFDSVSAGILIYTGLVEMLARDFIFNPSLGRNKPRIIFMLVSLYLGAGLMALLGKWA